ncbi:SOS response-associated peptidase [Polycladomyces sp. WAk]|uniref:Abasic site processing protein n=1 Tax=Polycladomyces zharkentensis TaxID=2807616 RepID=A0ABS2WNH8_9BACL|nr:SOS response-associated peptidase [Polycladomyces sp. WAk]MBN2911021.1 SOS response-associated peptidase [Polycladomyces sp. WAk]
MCGRFTLTAGLGDIMRRFLIAEAEQVEHGPRYNIAPTQRVPVVVGLPGGKRRLRMFRWGLVPHWARTPSIGQRMINARRETLLEKPAFRSLVPRRRCIIPADGYYEWKALPDKRKQPYRIVPKDGRLAGLAGLWDRWVSPEGETIDSFTIITTEAVGQVASIHDRMPVILRPEAESVWLDAELRDPVAAVEMLVPHAETLSFYPVSTLVNSPRNDVAQCIEPVEGE